MSDSGKVTPKLIQISVPVEVPDEEAIDYWLKENEGVMSKADYERGYRAGLEEALEIALNQVGEDYAVAEKIRALLTSTDEKVE